MRYPDSLWIEKRMSQRRWCGGVYRMAMETRSLGAQRSRREARDEHLTTHRLDFSQKSDSTTYSQLSPHRELTATLCVSPHSE